jgi:hypothetical protein
METLSALAIVIEARNSNKPISGADDGFIASFLPDT